MQLLGNYKIMSTSNPAYTVTSMIHARLECLYVPSVKPHIMVQLHEVYEANVPFNLQRHGVARQLADKISHADNPSSQIVWQRKIALLALLVVGKVN